MLGHNSIKTTQHYAKVLDGKISEDMEKLEEKLYPNEKPDSALLTQQPEAIERARVIKMFG